MMRNTEPSTQRLSPAERLLEVADRLFYERGYAATGINELIKEAGVAKASFYLHFPSKGDLIVAYLEQRRCAVEEGLDSAVEQYQKPEERLLALFDFLAQWLTDTDFRGCAFLNTVPEFADRDSAPRRVVRKTKERFRASVHELCTDAGLEDMGDEVFLLVEGATVEAAVMGDLWPITAARKAVERRLGTVP